QHPRAAHLIGYNTSSVVETDSPESDVKHEHCRNQTERRAFADFFAEVLRHGLASQQAGARPVLSTTALGGVVDNKGPLTPNVFAPAYPKAKSRMEIRTLPLQPAPESRCTPGV